jgi:poly(A) polymerase
MTLIDLRHLDHHPGARQALDRIWPVLPRARLVGGVVRDLIAGLPVSDIDLATPDAPQIVMQRLDAAGIRTVATGLAHGTVTAIVQGQPVEITTLRRDKETDGRHAVVAWTEDWREDAQRRDFTINAMSLDRDLALFDYFGGLDDLRARRVRFVGQAALRIAEDRLRILRFFRFHARYGGDNPDPEAITAIQAASPGLVALSAERVWSELRRILAGPDLAPTALLMGRLGVLDHLLPGGAQPERLQRLLQDGLPPDPVLRLAALINGDAARVAEALRLSNAEAGRLAALLATPVPHPDMSDDELRRLLADDPAELLCGRTWLTQAGSDADRKSWSALRERLGAMPRPVFPLAGRDVLACGLPPGPEIGRLLATVRAWWMADGCIAERAACLDRLRALAGGHSRP